MSAVQRGGPCPEMLRLQREEIATLRQELDAEKRLVGILRRAASRRERTLVALQRRLDGALTNRDEPRRTALAEGGMTGDVSTPNELPTHARLIDGSVVELEHDCGCVIHSGPHWLAMDRIRRLGNQRTLNSLQVQVDRTKDGGAWFALYDAYALAEGARCREKANEMERRGIAQLLWEVSA